MEYGLPSSHTLNTIYLSGYLLHYVLDYTQNKDPSVISAGVAVACLFVGLVGLVSSYWATLSFLLLFAYPTPELPTPSFQYHTAFNGVALGTVSGIQQTYLQFHHENVLRIFTPQLTLLVFLRRIAIGIPMTLIVKLCSKNLAKWVLPVVCNTLGVLIRSSSYIPAISGTTGEKKPEKNRQVGYLQTLLIFPQDSYDVDTGIRFLQYAGLAWSAVDLVPSLFPHLGC